MKKILYIVLASFILVTAGLSAQNASYLDSVYQTLDNASAEDPLQALKDSISDQFGIVVAEDQAVNQNAWPLEYVQAIKEVLESVPASFSAATRMIFLDPSPIQYEIKYVGFNDQHGIVQIGAGVMTPSVLYYKRFKEVYGGTPTEAQLLARFKTILVRGLTYSFLQENPDVARKYTGIAAQSVFPTKVYGPAAETNMIVAPGKSPAWVDLAFATSMYCTDPATLQSRFSGRFNFIKEMVMNGEAVSGWDNKPIDDGTPPGGNDDGDDGGSVEKPGVRPPPEIPDGDYLPIVTQVDVGTAAATLPAEFKDAPSLLSSAIADLFNELPKFFSTCTEAIAYLPTTDTDAAFSYEGYVFITQNSWFAPSFVELDDAARSKRFKQILLREMTLRFLYFHPEVTAKWKEKFDPKMTSFDAYTDMTQAAVLYYSAPDYLKQVNNERYEFVKTVIMVGKTFE